MTVGHALVAFTAAAGLLTITPGLDTALVLRTVAIDGSRRALLAVWQVATTLERATGAVLIGFGLELVWSRHR